MALTHSFKKTVVKLMRRNKDSLGSRSAIYEIELVIDFLNLLAYIVGLEFTNDWKFNSRVGSLLLMNISYAWIEGYTYYKLIPSITCVELSSGCVFTFLVRYLETEYPMGAMFNIFVSVVDFMFAVANKNTEGERQQILIDPTSTIFYHFKLAIFGFSSAAVVYTFYPAYDFIVNRNLTPVAPLIFPFDDGAIRGYLITTAINVFVVSFDAFAITFVTCGFMTIVDMYAALVTLIGNDFEKLDGMYRGNQNVSLRKVVFRNIMLELMDFARYNEMIQRLFGLIATAQICCCFLGIATALFGYMANNFVGGIGAFFYYTTELMIFCYIGQNMYNQTERIEAIIFNSNWYVYEIHNQKILLFALSIVQTLKSTAVGGIMPLNLETGVTVAKNIYSILMFLLNALE